MSLPRRNHYTHTLTEKYVRGPKEREVVARCRAWAELKKLLNAPLVERKRVARAR